MLKKKPILIMTVVLIVGGATTAALWPEPEPDEPEPVAEDTGMTRFQTEELMRTIGYVQ